MPTTKGVAMKRIIPVIAACFVMTVLVDATVDAQRTPQNVQGLTDLSTRDIREYMKSVSSGIGEKCDYCHNLKDYASDEKETKLIGREFIRLVEQVNEQVTAINSNVMKKEDLQLVTCYTCHAGELTIISEE
ncbi:MAG: photosynthetic reaction center cytochrome c subunit [Gemmatimonadetes bacterium]|nr:photosynthetic reaction center cytochrome c subunit [Gemmatimonadota bacterium]